MDRLSIEQTDAYRELVNVYAAMTSTKDRDICVGAGFGLDHEKLKDGKKVPSERWRTFKGKESRLTPKEAEQLNGYFATSFDERFYNYLLSSHSEICVEVFGPFGRERSNEEGKPHNRHRRRRQGQFIRELRQLVGEDLVHGMLEGLTGHYISYRYETDGSLILSQVELLEFVGDKEAIEAISHRLEKNVGALSFRGLVTASQNAIQMIGMPIPGKDFWMAQLQKTGGPKQRDLAGTLSLVSDVSKRPFAPPVYFARLKAEPDKEYFEELANFSLETANKLDPLLDNGTTWTRIKGVLDG